MTGHYKARTWQTLKEFRNPVLADDISVARSVLYREPEGLMELVRQSWDRQLAAKKAKLAVDEPGSCFEIRPYLNTGLDALYLGDTPKMWPGGAVTPVNFDYSSRWNILKLYVGETCFPMIDGLKDPAIRALYDAQGIPIPRPALDVSTVAESADRKLIMTVRGPRTNMYKGRVYGQGGNPTGLFDVRKHQADENREEIMVPPEEAMLEQMGFLGLVEDNEGFPQKAGLVGFLPVKVEAGYVAERVRKRHAEGKSPNDAVDVEVVDRTDGGLMDYLVRQPPEHFCPPAQGGLVLFGANAFGPEWARDLQKKADWLQQLPADL